MFLLNIYLCSTQLKVYILKDPSGHAEVIHYTSKSLACLHFETASYLFSN